MLKLFKNLWLADGSGNALRKCAVLIENDRIKAIEPDISESIAHQVFNCGKQILAPGFIDAHGHSDLSALARPECFGKISQGVTCEISGNCGLSPFPLTDRNRDHLQNLYAQYGVELTWNDCRGYQEELKRRKVLLKLRPLTGHNTLRAAVCGYEDKPLSPDERQTMRDLLADSLAQGSPGLSAGLLYVPGKFAAPGELVELMRIVSGRDRIFTVHLRSEGNQLLESMTEMLECAAASSLPRVHFSHFKTAGKANWGKLSAAFELMEQWKSRIAHISLDRYAYTESMTQLSVILPGELADLSDAEITRKLQNPSYAAAAAAELEKSRAPEYWNTVRLTSTADLHTRALIGKTIAEIAAQQQQPPAEFVISQLRINSGGCMAAFQGMSPENMIRIMNHPECVAGTDESARPTDDSIGRSHPRGFGGIARFLRLRLDHGCAIEQAVRQITGKTAELFQLEDNGKIAVGRAADLTVFNPEQVDGTVDFAAPHTPASGISHVMIDGESVYRPE